jgi:general stress protein YciG
MSRPPKAVSAYMASIGKKGGETTGSKKKRSTAHYKAAAAKRWGKKGKRTV